MGQLYYPDGSLVSWPVNPSNPFLQIANGLSVLNSPMIASNPAITTVPSPYREKLLNILAANQKDWNSSATVGGLGSGYLGNNVNFTYGYSGLLGPNSIGASGNSIFQYRSLLASPAGLPSLLNPPTPGGTIPAGVISIVVNANWNNQNTWSGIKFFGTQGYWPELSNTDYPVQTTNTISSIPGINTLANFNYSSSPPASLFPDISVSQLLIGANIVAIPTNLPANLWTPYVLNSGDGGTPYAQIPLYYYAWGIKILEVADFTRPTLRILAQSPYFYPGDPNGLQSIDGGDIITAYGTGATPVLPPPITFPGNTVPINFDQGPIYGVPNGPVSRLGAWFKHVDLPDSLLTQEYSDTTSLSDGLYGWATGLNPNPFNNWYQPVLFDTAPSWFAAGYFANKSVPYICPIQKSPDPLIQRPTLIQASSPNLPIITDSSTAVIYGIISPAVGPINPNTNTPLWTSVTPKAYRLYPSGRLVQNKVYFGGPVKGQIVTEIDLQGHITYTNNVIQPAFGIQGSFARPILEIPMVGEKNYKLYLAT